MPNNGPAIIRTLALNLLLEGIPFSIQISDDFYKNLSQTTHGDLGERTAAPMRYVFHLTKMSSDPTNELEMCHQSSSWMQPVNNMLGYKPNQELSS